MATALELHQLDRGNLTAGPPVVLQANTSTEHFSYRLEEVGTTERLAAVILLDGPALLRVDNTVHQLSPRSELCSAAGEGWMRCEITRSRPLGSAIDWRITPQSSAPLQIASFQIKWITARSLSPLSFSPFSIILLILLLGVPVVWYLHKYYAASQYAIIIISFSCLALIQPYFSILLIIFIGVIWNLNVSTNSNASNKLRRLSLLIGLTLSFLVAFKVIGPLLQDWISWSSSSLLLLPLGISYFVMRIIDTQLKAFRCEFNGFNFREFLCYIIFAPTVPAGPIETIENFKSNRLKRIGKDDVTYGVSRILIGIAKKVLIADALLRPLVDDNIYAVAMDPASTDMAVVFVLLLANFFFAYIDFSAYSDIAIGLSRLYGYKIRENFNWPVLRRNLRIYWQNWHMSLSNWAMRNIYLPIAIETRNKYLPIYATMIAIGLWHSLGLSWFLWAVHHSTGLAFLTWMDKRRNGRPILPDNPIGYGVGVVFTVCFVALGHSFVLFDDVGIALKIYARILGFS